MSCDITNGRIEQCKDSVSGLKAIYFINYDDLNSDDVIYDNTDTDLINDWTPASPLSLYKYELKGANSFETTINSSRDNGTTFFQQTLTIQLKRQEEEEAEEKKRLERQLESRRALLIYTRDELRKFEKEQAEADKKRREEAEAEAALNTRKNLINQVSSAQEVSKALSVITANNLQSARDQYSSLLSFEIESGNLSYKEQEKRFQQIRELERQKLTDRKATQAELDLFDKQSKEQEKKRDEAAAETKAQIISGALGTIADAVGRNTIAGKAASIAQATVDTYAGANKALATYAPPFGAIAAGTVILAGLLNVRKIIGTKIPPPPGSKGVSDNTTAPAAAPITPGQFIQSSPTVLNAQAIQELGSATNRAYVVESDVTNSQERIRRINRAARLS